MTTQRQERSPVTTSEAVVLARNILEIVWQLIADPDARYHDLGADWYETHTDPDRRTRELVRQLERLGNTVTLTPNLA
ncbi:hypothetical protein [Streptacidiphilus rugosus]|uniref:hypothetical protein n=1 Tax=Streptacidiphilus rugosus TaxID=405783 RepID=UPI00069010E8|nr:hypothetical protein [Streptacidiphilus rugosus]